MRTATLRACWASFCALLATQALVQDSADAQSTRAPQQPVAVIALAGIDRLLEDIDYLSAAGDAPQHAQMIRGVIANFNQLRGLDRQRPVGLYLFFPPVGQKDPQILLFFPVSDVDELLTSVRIGNALKLERTDVDDRLALHTEDGVLPVGLQHGFAFVDPAKTGTRLAQPQIDPVELVGEPLERYDAVAVIRREGIPPFLFEVAAGQLRTESLKGQAQKEGESDSEYAIRQNVQRAIFTLLESAVTDWRTATLGVRVSASDRRAQLDARLLMDADGQTMRFLSGISSARNRFAAQLAEPAAFALSANWQPTDGGRTLLSTIVESLRQQVAMEVADADDQSREAVAGLLDALEATAATESFDACVQLVGAPPNSFVLLGAIAIAESAVVATGIEQLLPFAADSDDIREIEMNVARANNVAIHRMWPQRLRKQDRRLYGDDAAIYLAAGRGALWMAIGSEGTAELLAESIYSEVATTTGVLARPESLDGGDPIAPTGLPLLDLTVHASDWVGFARTDGGGSNAQLAQLARRAFENPQQDRLRLQLHPHDEGLGVHLSLDQGYVRLFALALAARLSQN